MLSELEELTNALHHQSHACHLTVDHNIRVHAFPIITLLADLESRLASRNAKGLAEETRKMVDVCTNCIKTTTLTGRSARCIKEGVKEFEEKVKKLEHVKWEKITFK
jgi:hypothetical protein